MSVDKIFDDLQATRKNILDSTASLTLEQLNTVPEGLNNNIIWNMAHCVVTQQLLCYKLSNTPMHIDKDWVKGYAKGTKPEGPVDANFVEEVKAKLIETVDQARKDYEHDAFGEYNSYTTSFGVTLDSIADAIRFNNVHEGMHLGNILVMRKLV